MDQQPTHNAPFRCRRCPSPNSSPNSSIDVVRLRKALSHDNDVFRCVRCGLLFNLAIPHLLSVPPEVEGQALRLGNETKIPKLDSYENAANETKKSSGKDDFSYERARRRNAQTAPNRPQNRLSQLGNETKKSKLDSYENAANETKISYEKPLPAMILAAP